MMEIDENVIYRKEIENYSFYLLTKEDFAILIKDGRIGSRFMERLIQCYFPFLSLSKNGNSPFDFYQDKVLYDEKTLTKNGLSLTPSNQKGQGRIFNKEQFIKRNNELDYYVIADVTLFPMVEFVFVKTCNIDTSIEKYDVKKARNIFFLIIKM